MNSYIVGYEVHFFQKHTIEVQASTRAQAVEIACAKVKASGIGYGGNLIEKSFRVIKKINTTKGKTRT